MTRSSRVRRVGFERHVGAVLGSPLLAHPLGVLSVAAHGTLLCSSPVVVGLHVVALRPNHPSITREGTGFLCANPLASPNLLFPVVDIRGVEPSN